jgi:hypothetical protein
MEENNTAGLAALRVPFENKDISRLPKPTRAQTDEVKKDFKKGVRCDDCGGWHHPKVAHLDYVGHAALTHRLLEVDPLWNWEPVQTDQLGMPCLDADGGMWIKLTVCGVTRLGYGDSDGKKGPAATKERIGDALRNAGMRFGMALDLWHKGDLHASSEEVNTHPDQHPPTPHPLTAWSQSFAQCLKDCKSSEDVGNLLMEEESNLIACPASWVNKFREMAITAYPNFKWPADLTGK